MILWAGRMNDLKGYLLLASLLLAGYVVVLYNRPEPVNWTPTYARTDKIPYGTFILYQQLTQLFPGAEVHSSRRPVYNTLQQYAAVPGNYLVVADAVTIDRSDYTQIRRYLSQGGNVFVAAFEFGGLFKKQLRVEVNSPVAMRESTEVRLVQPGLGKAKYTFGTNFGNNYFARFDTARALVLGRNADGKANFISYKMGKGRLFLLASPVFFSNYALLRPAGAEYAERVLSVLPAGRSLVWDDYFSQGALDQDHTLLRVIFRYPSLSWAYLLALAGIVVFVLYGVKRRQRIIPVADPMANATLNFVRVVGQVYFQQHRNEGIAAKMVTYLFDHIRSRYRINPTADDAAAVLARHTGLDPELTDRLFSQVRAVQQARSMTDRELIQFNRTLENFYKATRS